MRVLSEWAQRVINNFLVSILIPSLSMTSPVVSGFLGLPFSDLQAESWGFSYPLCHILQQLHLHAGLSGGRSEKKNSRVFPAILGPQLLWSEKKFPLLQNFCACRPPLPPQPLMPFWHWKDYLRAKVWENGEERRNKRISFTLSIGSSLS